MKFKRIAKQMIENRITISDYQHIWNFIDLYSIISFDVFDTLLKRDIRNPQDVFELIEKEAVKRLGGIVDGFKEKRVLASSVARKLSIREELTLDEIYKQLPYDEGIKQSLRQIELDLELALTMPNLKMKQVYDHALSSGKEIILVSDMYWDKAFIGKLLSKCGYRGYKELYASSETGLLKTTGNMFRLILRENSYKASNILHIGDSVKADWYAPKRIGIKSLCIKTYENHMLYGKDMPAKGIDYNLLYNFINNTVYGSRYFRIGYETQGPLLYGFCHWLHAYKLQLGLDKLLFLSRDGQIIRKVYKELYPEDQTEYVYVSRRSLTVPLLHLYPLEEIIDILPIYRYTTVKEVLEILGVEYDDSVLSILEKNGFKEDMSLTKEDFMQKKSFVKLFSELKPFINSNSLKEFSAMKEYFNRLNIRGRIGIVDIGWKGRIQMALEKLLPFLNIDAKIYGFYMGTLMKESNSFGYIYSPANSEMKNLLKSFGGLFEVLFSANHGSVKKYSEGGLVDFYDFEYQTIRNEIEEIQSGSILFAKAMMRNSNRSLINWSPELAFYLMAELGTKTQCSDFMKIRNWPLLTNGIKRPLARPSLKARISYRALKKEFSETPWKIGYLRSYFIIPLPYFAIFKQIRNMVLKTD